MTQPGSTDPRGASPPYAPPLADRPGPEGVTLQVPGRSTMDGAYGAEASTIYRWIQADAFLQVSCTLLAPLSTGAGEMAA